MIRTAWSATTRRRVLALPAVAALGAAGVVATDLTSGSSAGATVAGGALPMQSPIDIVPSAIEVAADLPPLVVHYQRHVPVSVRYVSKDSGGGCGVRGAEETEEVDVPEGAGYVTLDGTRYDLAQFHFHTPSEHTVRGRHAPLEMHLVHSSAAGRTLVIGVLLTAGRGSEPDRILTRLPEECAEPIEVDDFDLASLVRRRPQTLRYTGSLTTSPYTEEVQWFLTQPQTVSARGIRSFQTAFPDGDSRAAQPLNGRTLELDGRGVGHRW